MKFSTQCGNPTVYCGSKTSIIGFEVESCSNTLTIEYVTTTFSNAGYRGFNLYYEGVYCYLKPKVWLSP